MLSAAIANIAQGAATAMRRGEIVWIALGCALFLAIASSRAAAQSFPGAEKFKLSGLDVTAWLPPAQTPGPWPVIIFSHGFRGCGTNSSFLMEALAGAGYAVFAPNHHDAVCGKLPGLLGRAETPFRNPENWTDQSYADRPKDIETLIDALQRDPRYGAPPFDWHHVGLIGHSLGGYTALELAGAWPRWKDPRIKAVLALSPYTAPFMRHHTLRNIDAPVMYQIGARDHAISVGLERHGGAYEQTPAPKYLVQVAGAGHFAWVDIRANATHKVIVDYGRAFFDRYLKGQPFPHDLEEPPRGVADLRFQQ